MSPAFPMPATPRHARAGRRRAPRPPSAFTIVEMMVAAAVFILLMGIIFSVTNQTSNTVRRASAKIDSFAASRAAFDLMASRLSQATLNTYWDYFDNQDYSKAYYYQQNSTVKTFVPARYARFSDLHFVIRPNQQSASYGQEIFFQSPEAYSKDPLQLSTRGLLNVCGFYVNYGSDANFCPATSLVPRNRFRLMQVVQPTESLSVYKYASTYAIADRGGSKPAVPQWMAGLELGPQTTSSPIAPLVDNVIALIVWPRVARSEDVTGSGDKLTTTFAYDTLDGAWKKPQPLTANQLPPTIQVTMIVISEAAAIKLDTKSATVPPAAITAALAGHFTKSNQSDFDADLKQVGAALQAANIEYEIFSTTVPMRESKWSDTQ